MGLFPHFGAAQGPGSPYPDEPARLCFLEELPHIDEEQADEDRDRQREADLGAQVPENRLYIYDEEECQDDEAKPEVILLEQLDIRPQGVYHGYQEEYAGQHDHEQREEERREDAGHEPVRFAVQSEVGSRDRGQ